MSEREALTKRTIPFMTLSDGTTSSRTAPPAQSGTDLNANQRAQARFTIDGNVIGTLHDSHLGCRLTTTQ